MAATDRGFTTGESIWTATRVPRDECSDDETSEDGTADRDDDAVDDPDDTPILTTTRAP